MTLPGLWWYIKDQYGTYWNDEALPSHFHAFFWKQRLVRNFPEFEFIMVAHQRSPIAKVPIPYIWSEEEDECQEKVKDPKVYVAHETEDF